ncbi:hypothetical protein IWX90DRAFT_34692 [Phyllosticta citrichinensis]|uniref:Uncharacterized protein n=1 Tax=Phyllosticta citrichinensis TaxID=1130410 RepID=A0ABR1Y837_9PEZI
MPRSVIFALVTAALPAEANLVRPSLPASCYKMASSRHARQGNGHSVSDFERVLLGAAALSVSTTAWLHQKPRYTTKRIGRWLGALAGLSRDGSGIQDLCRGLECLKQRNKKHSNCGLWKQTFVGAAILVQCSHDYLYDVCLHEWHDHDIIRPRQRSTKVYIHSFPGQDQ